MILFQPALGTAFLALFGSGLCKELTSSLSPLGTLEALKLPKFLDDGPLIDGLPWGSDFPDGYGKAPNTGHIRRYKFEINAETVDIDGQNKSMLLINGQFPGPTIEANWGDTIQVEVTNNVVEDGMQEGTSIHWHGLLQKKTPWYDGVPGVSQCPIAPGKTFTYTFQADQYGTSWYHSHYSSQYNDGILGPMIIYGPLQPGVKYDEDLGPIVITDYERATYYKILQDVFHIPPIFPNVDNNLINGKGVYDCSNKTSCDKYDRLSHFQFTPGKTYRLRLINASGAGNQKFTIDNHEMTIIANDFVPVRPYTTKVITLGIGQRTDVLVHATGSANDAVWMRSDIDLNCLNLTSTVSTALGKVYYPEADTNKVPNTTATPWQSNHCANDPLETTVPYYAQPVPENPEWEQELEITLGVNKTGHVVFFVDGSMFRTNYNHPILLLTKQGNTSYPNSPEWNVYNFGSNSTVRVIFKNTYEMQHPMHLHGHNFWVLAEGRGEWDGTIVRPENPQRRDTHILQPGTVDNPAYTVFEWKQDNPGIWPFHCHTSIHVSAGLYINVMEKPEAVKRDMEIPMVMKQTCRDWYKFSGTEVVDQIDSGVKL